VEHSICTCFTGTTVQILPQALQASGALLALLVQKFKYLVQRREVECSVRVVTAYVSIRQHASAYVSIRQHTSGNLVQRREVERSVRVVTVGG
jgi:hypothetical protein